MGMALYSIFDESPENLIHSTPFRAGKGRFFGQVDTGFQFEIQTSPFGRKAEMPMRNH
tara:strand:- start:88632 stop:88805 length:174 start_codon:yes stop_codon:yes gene_type:complete